MYELREAAKNGADIQTHEAVLKSDGSQLAASALTFYYARRARYADIDGLLASADARTRWGVVRALSEAFHPVHTDRLAAALLDADRAVQKQAFEGLEAARKSGQRIQLSPSVLARLSTATRADIVELVYLWTTTDVLCRICTNLDDFECHGDADKLPNEKRELVAETEERLVCPLCGTRYHFSWFEHDSNEFGSYGTWNLRRLSPANGTRTEGALHAGLSHPLRRVQRECAKALAATGDVALLRALLASPKRDVRFIAAACLGSAESLIPELLALLRDPDDDVRHQAAGALAKSFVKRGDLDGMRTLLHIDDRWVRWPALLALEEANDLDLTPLQPTIAALVSHSDDFVSNPARRILNAMRRE